MDLSELVHQLSVPTGPQVLTGLTGSEDAGVYRLADGVNLVVTADFIAPLCDDPYLFGQIAAANSLSDIYAMGGTPRTALNLCCFPAKGIERTTLVDIMRGGLDKLTEAGASLIGGHTVKDNELKYGLAVNGIVSDDALTRNSTAKPGDLLILTKPLGSGIASVCAKAGKLSEDKYTPLLKTLATLNAPAAQLMVELGASAATDITGFGLGGHAWEMAQASGCGIRIDVARLPIFDAARELLAAGEKASISGNYASVKDNLTTGDTVTDTDIAITFDPQTSGGLLIAIKPARADELVGRLRDGGVETAAVVGEVLAGEPGLGLQR